MTGMIPTELGLLTEFKVLAMGGGLTGTIPFELASAIQLEVLILRHNQLRGSIPTILTHL